MQRETRHADHLYVLWHPDSHVLRSVRAQPAHFHAYFGEHKATFSLDTLDVMEGALPRRQLRLVQAWAELHIDELRADWQLAAAGETPYPIEPLR